MSNRRHDSAFLGLIATVWVCAVTAPMLAAEIHVDETAMPNGNGEGWSTAFQTLQEALALAAQNGEADLIKVAQGKYRPAISDRAVSFDLLSFVQIEGGYFGLQGEPNGDDRDITQYETILSGDLDGDDEPGFVKREDNSIHVITATGVDQTAILDGVTISGGYADLGGTGRHGAGIFASDAWPLFRDCRIVDNYAFTVGGEGGALYSFYSTTTTGTMQFRRCTISNNASEFAGGAVYVSTSTFFDEFGHIAFVECSLEGNAVTGNYGSGDEGGCGGAVHAEVLGCSNESHLFLRLDFVNCTIVQNAASNLGGGISIKAEEAVEVSLTNCLVVDNALSSVNSRGGGVFSESGGLFLESCTVAANQSYNGGGVHYATHCDNPSNTNVMENTIFWGNTIDLAGEGEQITYYGASLELRFCALQGGCVGIGGNGATVCNDVLDEVALPNGPGFFDENKGQYQLTENAGVVGKGSNALLPPDTYDLDGDIDDEENVPFDLDSNTRELGTVEIGAYEFDCGPADTNRDGRVDFEDIMLILTDWGDCPDPPEPCPGDVNGSGVVDFEDILDLLPHWGCGVPDPPLLSEIFEDAGLDYPEDWDALRDKIENGTAEEKENYLCWIDHYYYVHFLGICVCQPTCPESDPYSNIPHFPY